MIRIGTRGSSLALWQSNYIEGLLREQNPKIELERIIIKTEGDQDQNSSLMQIGGLGVFTKAIEKALLDNKIDIAVHSLKDLPSQMTDELILAAVPPRGAVEDALVTINGQSLKDLAKGAKIASGSIRRRSQLLNLRSDLQMTDLRGNIDTRLQKLNTENLDGIIMACAALIRLDKKEIKHYKFSVDEMIPGVGQGAVGVQARRKDDDLLKIINKINHQPSYMAVSAERAFLRELDSGCQFPVGGYARINGSNCTLKGFVGSEDGSEIIVNQLEREALKSEELGRDLAKDFIRQGAQKLLNGSNG